MRWEGLELDELVCQGEVKHHNPYRDDCLLVVLEFVADLILVLLEISAIQIHSRR